MLRFNYQTCFMKMLKYIILIIIFGSSHITHGRNIKNDRSYLYPPPWLQTFRRDSVENIPPHQFSYLIRSESMIDSVDFEDEISSQFSRAAVESIPFMNFEEIKSPLRAAVEKRPPPDASYRTYMPGEQESEIDVFSNLDNLKLFDSEWITSSVTYKESPSPKLVCYVENWASNRKEPLAFTPQDLDPYLCTHVVYAFATIDPHSFALVPQDYEYDIVRGGYRSSTGLKKFNPELKVLLSVGGIRERIGNFGEKFSTMVSSPYRRQEFIRSVVELLRTYEFDGLDFHWDYPSAVEFGGQIEDKNNYVKLLQEVNAVFKQYDWLVFVDVSAIKYRLDVGYNLKEIENAVDLVILEAHDFYHEHPFEADHHSPLYKRDYDQGVQIFNNVEYAVQHILKSGIPRSKVILSLALYGRTFTLADVNITTPGAPIKGPGVEGYYTQSPGFLAYYEFCDLLPRAKIDKNRESTGEPYLVNGSQWIAYEDEDSLRNKVLYLKEMGLGGAAAWATDLDDFQGLCGVKSPLMYTIKHALLDLNNLIEEQVGRCDMDGLFNDPKDCSAYYMCKGGLNYHLSCEEDLLFDIKFGKCVTGRSGDHCVPGVKIQAKLSKSSEEKKVVCYLTNWAFYRKSEGKFVPEHLDPTLCTHIIYAFASLEPEQLIMKEFDPWADIDNNLYNRVSSIPDAKILLAIGGWTDSSGDKYSRLVSEGSSRRKFVASVVSFLRKHNFQGLHLDWNYPKCWQSNCKKGPESDKPNFTKLIQELRKEFNRQNPPLILAAAISGYKEVIDVAYELEPLGRALDFMSVMTYDYHGSWEQITGHVSPLYHRSGDKYPQYTTNFTMEYLVQRGAPRQKLLVGIPFYGQSFTLARHDGNYNYNIKAAGPGDAGEFTKQPGMLGYFEICYRVKNNRWQVKEDPGKKTGPYAFSRDQWVGFEDVNSIEEKMKYVMNNDFGGAVAWTVDLDDYSNRCCLEAFPLLKTINRGLGRLSEPAPVGGDCTKPPEPVTPPAPTLTTGVDSGAAISSTTSMHEHHHEEDYSTDKTSTWPSWSETTTQKTTTWPSWSQTTTTKRSTTRKPSTTTVWWVPESTTTVRSTTRKPTTTTTRKSTTTKKPTTAKPPPTSTIPTPAVIMPEVDHEKPPAESCETGQYIPDPQNCNAYYRCILGELRRQYCAGGLHWNKRTSVCDWPNVAKCSEPGISVSTTTKRPTTTTRRTTSKRPTKTTTTPYTTQRTTTTRRSTTTEKVTSTTSQNSENICNTGQYYTHESCNNFYVCVNGILISQSCGPGLVWDQEATMCDWEFKVPCSLRITNKVVAAYSKANSTKPRPESNCEVGTFTSHPENCNQYMMCLWGKYQLFNCAPGLSWNNARKTCDWPKTSDCTSSDEIYVAEEIITTRKPTITTSKRPIKKPSSTTTTSPIASTSSATTTTESEPNLVLNNGKYKLVCYFTNWAWYRKGLGKYLPENIRADLCTHIVYGFAVLDYENLIIRAHDSWADFDNKFYSRVVAYKAKGMKVTLALGGWNDSAGDKYSRLVNNPASRKRFIKQALQFLEKYDFDGLDLDWEYPKCWQTDCKKGPDSDKAAFAAFVQEIKAEFAPRGLLLSAAVSPSKTIIDAGYDVPSVSKHFDWIAVMTYDFHGQWDKQTGHVAPLYYHPDDAISFFNANYSIHYWIDSGLPREKLIMGVPLYGQSFTLENVKNNSLNAKAPGPGQAGEFTRAAGFLAYYEICDRVKNRGWTVVQDPKHRMGPYAYKGNQWVSFDDVAMIKRKAEYIKHMKLGGGMIWALDLDDFRDRCGEGAHPLLTTLRDVLASEMSEYEAPEIYEPEEMTEVIPMTTVTKTPVYTMKPTPKPVEEIKKPIKATTTKPMIMKPPTRETTSDYKVVCYFTNWAWYRQGNGKYLPSDIDPDLCTHVVYGFAVLNGDELIIKPHDTWADFDNKFYAKVTELRSKGIKVLIAIGGWNDSAGDKYSRLVNSPSSRRRFIAHVIDFIEENNFDGLDLDWEYPKCWQVDCKKGPESDKAAFAAFVRELRAAFKPKNLLLSAAVSPSKRVIDAGYDVPTLSRDLDWIAVMTYDFHGQWDKKTGHIAPMYEHPDDYEKTFNTNYTIHYWISQGADRKKLVLGMPLYGQSFSLAENNRNGLNAPIYGGGEAGRETRARGFLSYYEICENIQKKGWKVIRDRRGRMGPYAYLRDQWVSFDDQFMIEHKSQYIKAMGLGGGMVWALDLDDFRNICNCEEYPLLKTINRVLRGYPGPQPKCVLGTTTDQTRPTTQKPMMSSTTKKPSTTTNRVTTRKPTRVPIPTKAPKPSSTTTQRVTTSTTKNPKPADKACNDRMYIEHDSDCNKYYLCNYGLLQEQKCPAGLYWNVDRCDWPENAQCSDVNEVEDVKPIRPTPKPVTTMKPMKQTTSMRPMKPTTTVRPQYSETGAYKVVCYFTNWAWYRQGAGKYTPDDIDPGLCTHIAYGFAVLDSNSLTIKPHDSWADIDNNFYDRVTALKAKGIKVVIAIGGWNDSLGNKYSRLANDPAARARFITHVIQFIEKWNFDGLDLDWEYPKCWQVDCTKGPDSDKDGFSALVRELSQQFKPKGLLLSAAVSPNKAVIDAGYDVPVLNQHFDWIAVMTYDFHGHWDKQTGHVAPLYYHPEDTYEHFNANFTLNYWIEKGASPSKLIMGMPLYGQSFSLGDTSNRGLNAKTYGPGEAGEFTRAGGFLAYYEICDRVKSRGWEVIRDSQGRIGPYAYKGNQWVSYDDMAEIKRKANIIKDMGLGGGMIWALDLDDFRDRCGCGKHPLLNTLNNELRSTSRRGASSYHVRDCT